MQQVNVKISLNSCRQSVVQSLKLRSEANVFNKTGDLVGIFLHNFFLFLTPEKGTLSNFEPSKGRRQPRLRLDPS